MSDPGLKAALQHIADRGVPDSVDLWPRLKPRLTQPQSLIGALKARPVLAVLIVVLVLILLTGAAYAIGLITRYVPGIGFVQINNLRVLSQPVSQSRQGVTVAIMQVTADADRTVVIYKTEGLTIQAANSKGEGGGPAGFGSQPQLRLPDGTLLDEVSSLGYSGTPEPVISEVQPEGAWPNYVDRLVYRAVDPQTSQLTLIIPVLRTMPVGAAPENWEVGFALAPAPPNMTFAPMTQFPPVAPEPLETAPAPSSPEIGTPFPSNSTAINGFTFSLENVIELQDGFVFTGDLSWDDSVFPTGKGRLAEAAIPTLTDANGEVIPIEPVQLNTTYGGNHAPWSYRTDRKAFVGPLTWSIDSIKISTLAPPFDFELNFGTGLQIGQTWEIDRDFVVNGHSVRLVSVSLVPVPDSCQGVGLNFDFRGDVPSVGGYVGDLSPVTPMACSPVHGGGGGGGPVEPNALSAAVTYRDIPSGLHRYSINLETPSEVKGPWQVLWQPPEVASVTVVAERQACLTHDAWISLIERPEPLPLGLRGKLLTTLNEGGPLPAVRLTSLDGTTLGDFGPGSWPSVSVDGTHLVYGSGDALQTLDLRTGRAFSFRNDGYAHHWSPDNTHLLYTTTFGLYVINADGSGLRQIDTGPAQVLSVVGWLTDNQTVVYGAMGGAGFTFTTRNLQTGETKQLFTIQNKAGYGALSPDGRWIIFADRIFGADNWGIFASRLDGSDRRPVAAPDVPTAFESVWGPDGNWVILNTQKPDGADVPIMVDPCTCQAAALNEIHGIVESWTP